MSDDGGGRRDRQLDAEGLEGILELMPMWMDPEGQKRFVTRLAMVDPLMRTLSADVYEMYGVEPPAGAERLRPELEGWDDRFDQYPRGLRPRRPRGDC